MKEGPALVCVTWRACEPRACMVVPIATVPVTVQRLGLIDPLPAEDRRHPYRITARGAAALRVHLDSVERVSAAGRLRLQLGGI